VRREFYLDLARSGLRMPIGADLVLHERPDPDAVVRDGRALGQVVEETARRYQTPLAFAHMDLQLEKTVLLELLGVPAAEIPLYHFPADPGADAIERVATGLRGTLHPALRAHIDSVAYIASTTELVPIGMTIGPFSLMTKLLQDPITPLYLAGSGVGAAEEPDVALLERALELSLTVVRHSVAAQVQAGARAIFMAEPAANVVYISPKQIAAGSEVFERYAIGPNRQIKALLTETGADLIFHCCGELNEYMLRQFCAFEPVLLSLGSSRRLWEDAALVPPHIILYGNLPSKHFYSDAVMTVGHVEALTCELLAHMAATGHPFILGTECDVLHVAGSGETIRKKVDAFVHCRCDGLNPAR
jgi:uroporphyrinogen-III decarboxylase